MKSVFPIILMLGLGSGALGAPAKKPAKSTPASPSPVSPEVPAPAQEPAEKKMDGTQKLASVALAAFTKGDLVTAKREFLKVLELAPGNVPTMINLGLLEYRQQHYPEARKWLSGVVRSQPESGLGWLILGMVEYESDHLDAALAALAQAVLLEPKDARTHHFLGVTIGRKGWYSGAEEEMRKAIELDPNYAEAHFNLAQFYLQRVPPSVELARRHYSKARELGAAADPQVDKILNPAP